MTNNTALIVPAQAPAATNAAPPAFRDAIKPLINIPNIWLWIGGIVAVLLLAAAAWMAWRYWQKKRGMIRLAPPVPPHVHARRVLEQALSLIGDPKAFSTAVSGAIRVYLEQRFDLHAPERTTEEFLYELQESHLLTVEQKHSLGEFLASCDLIKFAKYEPTEMELRGLHAAALRLVNETEPRTIPSNIQSSTAVPPPIPATR